MKIVKLIWSAVILPSCAIYTLLTMVTNIFMTSISTAVVKPALPLSSCIMFLVMSLFISVCALIFRISKLPLYLKTVLNFVCTLLSIIMVITFGSYELDANSLVLIIVYTVLYFIIVMPTLFIISRLKRRSEEETEYQSMFSEKDSDSKKVK